MIEFKAILDVEAAMVAVERNGEALQYVPEAQTNGRRERRWLLHMDTHSLDATPTTTKG